MITFAVLSETVAGLRGWQRNAVAFVFGVCATFTLAPFYIFPCIIPAYAGLYWLVDSAPSARRRFWDGWWWGWGFYMTGLYWFCVALLTDAASFGWLIPFALFGLTGVIAIYSGVACWLMGWVRVSGLTKLFAFTIIWTVVEYARGHLFTGFPWNLGGYSFGFSNVSLQTASLVGAYGLTWFTLLLGCSLVAFGYGKAGRIYFMALWGLFFLGLGWGAWRLPAAGEQQFVEGIKLRLVQANISQPHKWDPRLQMQGMQENIHLSQSPGMEQVTHIIWPETAIPYVVKADSALVHLLGNAFPEGDYLISGALRSEGNEANWNIWNSMVMIDHAGAIVGTYDKSRLVPFGEFQPLRDFVPKEWMTPVGDKDFSRGISSKTLNWPHLPPFIPLICYEAIFPEMSSSNGTPAQLLVDITNDAWFGSSIGPYQHFGMNRMRAVEQGVPLVRVANTGITAMINGFGGIEASLSLGSQGILDVRVPKALAEKTLYGQYGEGVTIVLMFLCILILGLRKNYKINYKIN